MHTAAILINLAGVYSCSTLKAKDNDLTLPSPRATHTLAHTWSKNVDVRPHCRGHIFHGGQYNVTLASRNIAVDRSWGLTAVFDY